jgi:phage baseplate assembly protein W
MSDCFLPWGEDIAFGPDGDLSLISGSDLTSQRILRRLLTNQGGYLWHPSYGGSLANYVGSPSSGGSIAAAIRGQMYKEPAVQQTPRPQIDLISAPINCLNEVALNIQYTDASSGNQSTIAIKVEV